MAEPAYIAHLSKDKKLLPLLLTHQPFELQRRENVCLWLCRSIMGQQLSTKVAEVIYQRFLNLFDGKKPEPDEILEIPVDMLRTIGLSNAKATYVHNVSLYFLQNSLTDSRLYNMSDDEVREVLLPIKGVGPWTIEMLLMFTLGHEDVFAVDDLGLQQAMTKLYRLEGMEKKDLKQKLLKISAKWAPYRTYACLHLWHYKDKGL